MMNNSERIKILLMDDESDIREVIEIILMSLGYDVFTAENGEIGLEIFKKELPAIVITDIKMPGIDGITVLKKVKAAHPDTEVIMITGHGDNELAIKSLKYEAIDFITKPVSNDALEIALKRADEKINTRRQLREHTENLERLLKEKTELQDHLSSLGAMIGSISHGIKGLLTRLDGGVYIIESACKNNNPDDINDGLGILNETVYRIKKMVLDILYYAKKRDLNLQKTDIRKFSKDLAGLIAQKIKNNNIQFTYNFNDAPIECEIDEDLLHPAIINILDNALDACTDDRTKTEHQIEFSVSQDNEAVIFEVRDNGKGMDKETKERAFELCYSSKGRKGTGFGLFITDDIIKKHNGTIAMVSESGKGTAFTIRIPKETSTEKIKERINNY